STLAQVEIFGPVLAAMTFRTPEEAVALANNTRFGLAASIWSEDINLALDIATQIKAGTIWINATNLFDAASGFGGYRESGFGREGGREGLFEYVKRRETLEHVGNGKAAKKATRAKGRTAEVGGDGYAGGDGFGAFPGIDRTPKLFIGGKQARPDSGYSLPVYGPDGALVGEVGRGNRKDLRNAVEAARKAADGWARTTGHAKAQILYYLAENLAVRTEEFARRLVAQTGMTDAEARTEVEGAVSDLFTAAAWADKYDGAIHGVPHRTVTLAVNEPIGVVAVLCPDDHPLRALTNLVGIAVGMGNTVVAVPSPVAPLTATDFYTVLETSDMPAGVLNIVTGDRDELGKTLAEHDDVDGIVYAGPEEGGAMVEKASAGNMKRTWTLPATGPLPPTGEALRETTQVKNIWVPYGA
ncbi:MAG TPA: aldehyde dehydrogenase family protein, partial [Rhodothermales bacterium]|nr:aldehyde dehydrogenase family protein [Rhodothermales bacterium]